MEINQFKIKAKETMKNNAPGYGWRINNFGEGPRCFYLDNGNQTYIKMEFYDRKESDEEIVEMARIVAKELEIECNI